MSVIVVSVASSAMDGRSSRTDTVYPPVAGGAANTSNQWVEVYKWFESPNYQVWCGLFRFDTSVVPDDALITEASFRVWVDSVDADDARSLVGDYLVDAAITTSDYAVNVGTTAIPGTLMSAIDAQAPGQVTLALSNPDANIDKTGNTKIRLGIDGGVPVGSNAFFFASWDHATFPAADLIITYTPFQGSADAAWLTA